MDSALIDSLHYMMSMLWSGNEGGEEPPPDVTVYRRVHLRLKQLWLCFPPPPLSSELSGALLGSSTTVSCIYEPGILTYLLAGLQAAGFHVQLPRFLCRTSCGGVLLRPLTVSCRTPVGGILKHTVHSQTFLHGYGSGLFSMVPGALTLKPQKRGLMNAHAFWKPVSTPYPR